MVLGKRITMIRINKIQRFIENQKMDKFHLYERQTSVTNKEKR